jgi:hypothetical protein
MLRRLWPVTGLCLIVAAFAFAACETIDFRRSQAGETCSRTDDCEAPLVCIKQTCVEPGSAGGTGGGQGGAGGTTTTTTTTQAGGTAGAGAGGTAGAGAGGTGGTGGAMLDPVECAKCLDKECAKEEAACDSDCLALEACIETLCGHLSELGSPDEGPCQVHCQQAHLASKQKHLDVVNCAASSSCAPCSSYPFDYNACVTAASGAECKTQLMACVGSQDCTNYRDCLNTCASLKDCLACGDAPGGQAGSMLLLDFEQCIAGKCIAESWLQ